MPIHSVFLRRNRGGRLAIITNRPSRWQAISNRLELLVVAATYGEAPTSYSGQLLLVVCYLICASQDAVDNWLYCRTDKQYSVILFYFVASCMQCDFCSRWTHSMCATIEDRAHYRRVKVQGLYNLPWYCDECSRSNWFLGIVRSTVDVDG